MPSYRSSPYPHIITLWMCQFVKPLALPASSLLPPAFCLQPPASCLLPPASCLLPPAFYLLPPFNYHSKAGDTSSFHEADVTNDRAGLRAPLRAGPGQQSLRGACGYQNTQTPPPCPSIWKRVIGALVPRPENQLLLSGL